MCITSMPANSRAYFCKSVSLACGLKNIIHMHTRQFYMYDSNSDDGPAFYSGDSRNTVESPVVTMHVSSVRGFPKYQKFLSQFTIFGTSCKQPEEP